MASSPEGQKSDGDVSDAEGVEQSHTSGASYGSLISDRAAHISRLKRRKDGPYYIAPDSVEPSPSGLWSGLDPDVVETTAKSFPEVAATERDPKTGVIKTVSIPAPQREILEAGGDAAHQLLKALERGL
jgi:hypothetical protein